MVIDTILEGHVIEQLKFIPDNSIDCCITSPPYWGLRDYGVEGQIGLEKSPYDYVDKMVEVFKEIRRVLKDEGTCWLNLGDSYVGGGRAGKNGQAYGGLESQNRCNQQVKWGPPTGRIEGLKTKDLCGIPWRVAFALQADGWYLRQDIIWHKPNPMPESVTDRCTKSHEYIFLLTKNAHYFYDAEAIKEPLVYPNEKRRPKGSKGAWEMDGREMWENGGGKAYDTYPTKKNKRSVWTITTKGVKEAHFATYPIELVEPCVLAGCPKDGIVLDPFFGSGTTGIVALMHDRHYLGIELNSEYIEIAKKRIDVFNSKPKLEKLF